MNKLNKFKKITKIIFIFITFFLILNTIPALAADEGLNIECKKGDVCYQTEVAIPGFPTEEFKVTSKTLGLFIQVIYEYLMYAAGVLAVIVIMVGGVQWITAGGNQSKIGEAKERVTSAIIGLGLALGSYLILFTINTDLVKIHDLNMPSIVPIDTYCQKDQQVTFDAINNPIDAVYDARLRNLGINDFILADQVAISGEEAYCGFNYYHEVEGIKYECQGSYCGAYSDAVCYNGDCVNKFDECNNNLCNSFFDDGNANEIVNFNSLLNENQECVFAKNKDGDPYLCKYCSWTGLNSAESMVNGPSDCDKLQITKVGNTNAGCWYKVCVSSPFCEPDIEHRKCIAK